MLGLRNRLSPDCDGKVTLYHFKINCLNFSAVVLKLSNTP